MPSGRAPLQPCRRFSHGMVHAHVPGASGEAMYTHTHTHTHTHTATYRHRGMEMYAQPKLRGEWREGGTYSVSAHTECRARNRCAQQISRGRPRNTPCAAVQQAGGHGIGWAQGIESRTPAAWHAGHCTYRDSTPGPGTHAACRMPHTTRTCAFGAVEYPPAWCAGGHWVPGLPHTGLSRRRAITMSAACLGTCRIVANCSPCVDATG